MRVDYSYEFLPASGLTGTIYLHAVSVGGNYGMMISSLYGTGDFEGVQIRATGGAISISPPVSPPIYSYGHSGWVYGWPE
jgi:hypothetical protein